MISPSTELRSRDFKKILLIKLSAVGDIVQTLPVLNKLRRRYPSAQLDWLVATAGAELIRPHPAIDNVIEFARHEWSQPWRWTPLANSLRLARRLRETKYDLVLDLQGQFRSAAFALATGAPVRIGFDRPRPQVWEATPRTFTADARRHAWQGAREGSWLAYTHRIAVPTLDLHAVDRYLQVVPLLGLDDGPADFSFPIPAAANSRIDTLLADHNMAKAKLVVVAPGTAWETKQWLRERFAEAARHFQQGGFAVALVGSARERPLCEEVAALAPGAVNLCGETSLSELAALIGRAAICLTNDSGPMHLAVALNRPVVSIFGPTDPVWIGPYRRDDAVLRAGVPCSPCYLRQLSRCRFGHVCMHNVQASTVIGRMEAMLSEKTGGKVAAKA